jgi:putative membrane protein insertion efficiency factor
MRPITGPGAPAVAGGGGGGSGSAPFSWPARAALGLLALYKALVSPMLPRVCRFTPTCSEYAAGAIRRHGLARGAVLAARRLARCRPGVPGGHDPVP